MRRVFVVYGSVSSRPSRSQRRTSPSRKPATIRSRRSPTNFANMTQCSAPGWSPPARRNVHLARASPRAHSCTTPFKVPVMMRSPSACISAANVGPSVSNRVCGRCTASASCNVERVSNLRSRRNASCASSRPRVVLFSSSSRAIAARLMARDVTSADSSRAWKRRLNVSPTVSDSIAKATLAAIAGCRRAQRQRRPAGETGRAAIGSNCRTRRRSSANSSAVW